MSFTNSPNYPLLIESKSAFDVSCKSRLPQSQIVTLLQSLLGPPQMPYGPWLVAPLLTLNATLLLAGVLGNATVSCVALLSREQFRKSGTSFHSLHFYIASMCVAGVLALVSGVPYEALLELRFYPFTFGHRVCVGEQVLSETATVATALSLLLLCLHRSLTRRTVNTSNPEGFQHETRRIASFIIVLWTIAFLGVLINDNDYILFKKILM